MGAAALLCVAAAGCKDDDGDDGGGPPPASRREFTAFVRELILERTSETGLPVGLDGEELADSEPVDAFPASFFP